MSTTEQPVETSDQAERSGHGVAIAVVLLVTSLVVLVTVVFSFTTANTDFSVDGNTATTSSYTGADQAP